MTLSRDQIVTAGAQEAAAVLARLLRTPVYADQVVGVDAAQLAAGHGSRVVVIIFEASGGISGSLGLVIDEAVAASLACLLTGATEGMGEGGFAALAELGNIVASAFLNGVARVVGRTCLPSVPRVLHTTTTEALATTPGTLRVVTLRAQQHWFNVLFSG